VIDFSPTSSTSFVADPTSKSKRIEMLRSMEEADESGGER